MDALQKPRTGHSTQQQLPLVIQQPASSTSGFCIYRVAMAEQLLEQVRDVVDGQIVGVSVKLC